MAGGIALSRLMYASRLGYGIVSTSDNLSTFIAISGIGSMTTILSAVNFSAVKGAGN
jgi:hypothetical protein